MLLGEARASLQVEPSPQLSWQSLAEEVSSCPSDILLNIRSTAFGAQSPGTFLQLRPSEHWHKRSSALSSKRKEVGLASTSTSPWEKVLTCQSRISGFPLKRLWQ